MNEDDHNSINVSAYSPAIARRTRKLKRTVSSPVLLPSSLTSDLPPLVGAPGDPISSRYAYQDKNIHGTTTPTKSPESPTITRRGRQLKPLLIRQGSEPQLSHRFSELKIKPNPPDHESSPRSNGSSACNSPRLIRTHRTFSRSVEGSPATVRRTFPGATPVGTSPVSPPSPLITSETPFGVFSSPSAPNSPFMTKRGTTVKLRRPLVRPNTPDVIPPRSPGHETKRYSLPISLTDGYSSRNGLPRQLIASDDTEVEHLQHLHSFAGETNVKRTVDDETGEPVIHAICNARLARVRHHSGPGDGSSSHSDHGASLDDGHSGYVTNQSVDMLYDIEETHDEVQEPRQELEIHQTSDILQCPVNTEDEAEADDDEADLPEYQKTPLSTKNRVTQWLQGLQPSGDADSDGTLSRTEKLLPDIHDVGGLS